MLTLQLTESYGSIQGVTTRTGDGKIEEEVAIPAAFAGALSNRGGNGAGTINGLTTGHGLQAGNLIDVFWVGGRRYNVTIDTANANDIIFDDSPAGAGDNLPVQGTAVTICKQVVVNTSWDGDDSQFFAAMQTARGNLQFRDGGAATLKQVDLVANEPWRWLAGQGITNPLTGNAVATLRVTNADSAAAATFRLLNLFDSTP